MREVNSSWNTKRNEPNGTLRRTSSSPLEPIVKTPSSAFRKSRRVLLEKMKNIKQIGTPEEEEHDVSLRLGLGTI